MQKIIERVKAIVLKPRETWEVITTEEDTIPQLFKEYFLLLAAIPAAAMFLGNWIVGYKLPFRFGFGGIIRLSFIESLLTAAIWYILTAVSVWLLGKVISFVAPKFGSPQDDVKGFKVAVYTYTPYLAVGIFFLIPQLGVLATLAGLYGFYLLYIGIPIVMGTPKDKTLAYVIVIAVALILIYIIIGLIQTAIFRPFVPSFNMYS